MAHAERSIDINAPIEHVFEVITDYEKYPEFIPEMEKVVIEKVEGNDKQISYEISVFKVKVSYTLKLHEEPPYKVSWTLLKSNWLKSVDGYWHLEKLSDDTTKATYSQELKIKGLVPKSISSTLANVNLPAMLKQFKDRCESTWKK